MSGFSAYLIPRMICIVCFLKNLHLQVTGLHILVQMGVGISVRRQTDGKKLKAGFYKLYENNVELNDDVSLFELNQQITVSPKRNVGGSVYYIKDNSSG